MMQNIFSSRAALVCAIACVSSAVRPVPAQQSGKIIGARLKTPQPFNYVRVPEAQKAAAGAMMQKLYDIVRRDTMFYEPVAFDVQSSPQINLVPRPAYAPIEYSLPGFVYAFGKDAPATDTSRRTTATAFWVYANGLGHFFRATDKWQEDEQGMMYWEPQRQGELKGFPIYGKGLAVITKNERPLFVPVARERALRLVIAQNKKGIEGMTTPAQQQIVAQTKACITKLEQELASLSAGDRAGPTYVSMAPVPGRDPACDQFSSATDRNARRIIAENPDFYDRTLPPTAIQVVFVNLSAFSLMRPEIRAQVDRIKNQLDVAALAALTARP